MRNVIVCLFCLLIYYVPVHSQSYGLEFKSHETVPEKRTSIELTPNDSLSFPDGFRLDFDLNFIPSHKTYFGYVLRIIGQDENVDLLYDQKTSLFRVVVGQKFSGISFELDSTHLFHQWNTVSLALTQQKTKLEVFINQKLAGSIAVAFQHSNRFKFYWGANDDQRFQTRDIPPMRLRDIRLSGDQETHYYWRLNEVTGTTFYDSLHHTSAIAKNPVWIRPGHQKWNLVKTFVVKGNAVTSYDAKDERVIISGSDSIVVYSVRNIENPWGKSEAKRGTIMPGVQAVYDTITGQLYNIFTNQKKVGSFRFGDAKWNDPVDTIMNEYGHANKFISPYDSCLYIIGGYGQLTYKNTVQRYRFSTGQWETVKTKGNVLPPRYLAALGLNSKGDTAFIAGGYGSRSGDQMLDPGNYYDIYAFDIKTATFTKLVDFDDRHQKFTFANSLVIDSKNEQYYGLIFPNDSFNSKLRLIQGSLKDSSYNLFESEIPFSFYDVQSFADLYYAPEAGKLIAVTLLNASSDNAPSQSTTVNIYTINFPPANAEKTLVTPDATSNFENRLILILCGLTAVAGIAFLVIKKRRKLDKHNDVPSVSPVSQESGAVEGVTPEPKLLFSQPKQGIAERTKEANAHATETQRAEEAILSASQILLFGQFQVFDKQGKDITSCFTPLIKELFLLIVIYTFHNGRGITSEELNEILWHNKSVKDAKNNRSVNLAKLKNILEKLGDTTVAKKSNFWQIETAGDSVFIDYEKFVILMREKPNTGRAHMESLLSITRKGSFLFQTEYGWLDDVKAEISNLVIDDCLKYLNEQSDDVLDDPEFVIEIANCIFHFDQLNEYALEYKCKNLILLKRHALANKTFAKFLKDYKDMYGEEFGRSFLQLIKSDSPDSLQV